MRRVTPSRRLDPRAAVALLAVAATLIVPDPAGGCRFWALIGQGYPQEMLAEHLRDGTVINLQRLSWSNDNGWGIASFPSDASPLYPLNRPVVRRGGPPAAHPYFREFSVAVDEASLLNPSAAMAHVRNCSGSHCGVPDPHPFLRDGFLFAHNGKISDTLLVNLLTSDDPRHLEEHPPEYVDDMIDSELYFLYLLKRMEAGAEIGRIEALRRAIADLAALSAARLNFVLTAGDTLYALRHAQYDTYDPVRYYPSGGEPSPYWVVASQTLGSVPGNWPPIPERTLAVFIPGEGPRFYAVDDSAMAALPEGAAPQGGSVGILQPAPNPAGRSVVRIPLLVRTPRPARVAFEIADVGGRIVWREGPFILEPGYREIAWDTRDRDGREVASGTYYCRVFVDGASEGRVLTVVR